MDNAGYVSLTRLKGLLDEFRATANNIANMSTTGYRREGLVFSEYVKAGASPGRKEHLSMATARAHFADPTQGVLQMTNGKLDFAIEGDGYFLIEGAGGPRLTRFGAFALSVDSELVLPSGERVLDAGGGPVFFPPNARTISVSPDGVVSADGEPVAELGLVDAPLETLKREGDVLFEPLEGFEPSENGRVAQGYLEASNVNPIIEMSRMIEVQRAYEMSQNLVRREDERIRDAVKQIGQL